MTVTTTLNKIIYPGNAAQTAFPFTFAFPGGTATQEAANIQVFFTDTLGNITQLVQGSGAANYQITFNPATGTNPTPNGGTVTYNPGSPIGLGTFLTILRTLPLTQSTSLANQGTLYQPVEEGALDYQLMVSQQILEVQSRALVVPVTDSAPTALPAKSARAGLFLAFDSSGNPIASQPGGSNTPVSSAMAPVVTAASLAAGRSAFGLGSVATQSAGTGSGLAVFGAGLFVSNTIVTDSSTPITLSATNDINSTRIATVAITYNLPSIATIGTENIWFYAEGGNVTLTPNGSDKFVGGTSGGSMLVPQGMQAVLFTDGTNWHLFLAPVKGTDAPSNLQIVATVASSALTIALKDRNGVDPSAASPVLWGASATGTLLPRAITAPLSITVPNGATLGTGNGQANRIWVAIFDNSGSPVLGVYNSLTLAGPSIFPWDETTPANTTAISAGSTNSQVWYTNGVSLSAKPFKVIGYIESTQPTAGAWTVSPSKVQLFGPGVKKPGDTVQEAVNVTSTADTTISLTFVALTTAHTIVISPQSAANLIRVEAQGGISASAANGGVATQLSRGTVAATNLIGNVGQVFSGSGNQSSVTNLAYDTPNTTSSTTYAIQGKNLQAGTLTYGGATTQTIMSTKEIQI